MSSSNIIDVAWKRQDTRWKCLSKLVAYHDIHATHN